VFCALSTKQYTVQWISSQTTRQQLFYGPLSGTNWVSGYQKKYSPTHHHPDHHPIFISFFHLPRSIASSLFKLRAWQSFCTTSLHVVFGPLGLEPSTSYYIYSFTQTVSSFRSTCPYHRILQELCTFLITNTCLTASIPGQLGYAGTKLIWILMKQETVG